MRRFAPTALVLGLLVFTPALGAAADFLGQWGSNGKGDGQFGGLGGIATDRQGHIYVADDQNSRVEKFTTAGAFIRSIGPAPGTEVRVDRMLFPEGIAVAPNGNLYVVEGSNRARISVWTPAGRFVTAFADFGSSDGQIDNPGQLAIDGSGAVYVADADNHRIEKFSADGRYVTSIGRGEGLFVSPDKLDAARSCDRSGREHLRKRRAYRRVQHYAADGRFLGSIGEFGSGPGQFQAPQGVAVAGDGSVYVADRALSTVQRFSASGRYLETLGRPGSGDGAFSHPTYLALDCKGSLYVADADNYRVARFGDRGAAPCGDAAADPSERLTVSVSGAARQHFGRTFAIVLGATCSRSCSLVVTGRVALPGGGSVAIHQAACRWRRAPPSDWRWRPPTPTSTSS
jgi:DNA-binding beta-propeller fold protein YncE